MIDPLKVKAITKEANAYMEKKGYLYRLNKDDVEIVLEAAERVKKAKKCA